jgi:CheY-like chemotaxis protein
MKCSLFAYDQQSYVVAFPQNWQGWYLRFGQLQAFNAGTYDLAILDVRLPGMDGFELCERLKGIDHSLKVCFFTASEFYHKNPKNEQHSVLINKYHLIRKPISNEDLLKQVREVLELK